MFSWIRNRHRDHRKLSRQERIRNSRRGLKRRVLLEKLDSRQMFDAAGLLVPVTLESDSYSQDFDAGLPAVEQGWEYHSTNNGRIQAIQGDQGSLRMDASSIGYSLNEAILHVDLEGRSGVTLTLDHDSISDENTSMPAIFVGQHNSDGIAISDDGQTWHRLTSLRGDFESGTFSLDDAIADAGIEYTSDFQIKFQQYDNFYANYDGRSFDNVRVAADPQTGSEEPTSEELYRQSFNASDQSDWTFASTAAGRIRTENGRLEMDSSQNRVNSLNEAVLHLDLQGRTGVELRFDHENTRDENRAMPASFTGSHQSDGVAISSDGVNWYRLTSLTSNFNRRSFDLDAATNAAGIQYTSDFQIKFQQYDNYSMPIDGRAIDNVVVSADRLSSNQAPVGNDDTLTLDEDTSATMDVLANDFDADGDALEATIIVHPRHGTLTKNDDGSLLYSPDDNYHGTDTFSYVAIDGTQHSQPVDVAIVVNSINDAPNPSGDSFVLNEDSVVAVVATSGVLENDSDVDGDSLTATLVNGPANGGLTLNHDGSFRYKPNSNFNGIDEFTYVVSDGTTSSEQAKVVLTVQSVNDAPVAGDDAFALGEDQILVVPAELGILANDLDIDGDALTIDLVDSTEHGELVVSPDGSIIYTPDANFHGTDSFQYTVSDGTLSSEIATAIVQVRPVQDAPVIERSLTFQATSNQTLSVSATEGLLSVATDADGDAMTVELVAEPTHGLLTLGENGAFQYAPHHSVATDTISYRVTDGVGRSEIQTFTIQTLPVSQDGVVQELTAIDHIEAIHGTGEFRVPFEVPPLATGQSIVVSLVNQDGQETIVESEFGDLTSNDVVRVDSSGLIINTEEFVGDLEVRVHTIDTGPRKMVAIIPLFGGEPKTSPRVKLDHTFSVSFRYGVDQKGVLHINAGSNATKITVSETDGRLIVRNDGESESDDADWRTASLDPSTVKSIVFVGSNGDDTFVNETSIPVTASGRAGDDVLLGGAGNDELRGGDGNDTLFAMLGDDLLLGGDGDDVLNAVNGTNELFGEAGIDKLFAGSGIDFLDGGAGLDLIATESRDTDTIVGTSDRIFDDAEALISTSIRDFAETTATESINRITGEFEARFKGLVNDFNSLVTSEQNRLSELKSRQAKLTSEKAVLEENRTKLTRAADALAAKRVVLAAQERQRILIHELEKLDSGKVLSTGDDVFIHRPNGDIFRLTNDGHQEKIGGGFENSATVGGQLYARDKSGSAHRYLGSPNQWKGIGSGFTSIASDGRDLYALHNSGNAHILNRSTDKWSANEIGGNFAFLQAAGDRLYVLDNDGKAYRYNYGGSPKWVNIGANFQAMHAVRDQLYVLGKRGTGNEGKAFRFNGSSPTWELIGAEFTHMQSRGDQLRVAHKGKWLTYNRGGSPKWQSDALSLTSPFGSRPTLENFSQGVARLRHELRATGC